MDATNIANQTAIVIDHLYPRTQINLQSTRQYLVYK